MAVATDTTPKKPHLRQGLIDETTAFFRCSDCKKPVFFDHDREENILRCFCEDVHRFTLLETDDEHSRKLACGHCKSAIRVLPSGDEDEPSSYECDCDDISSWDYLGKHVFMVNAGSGVL